MGPATARRLRPRAELDEAVTGHAERLARRMERKGRAGRTVVLRLRFGDYTRASRSCTLGAPTGDAEAIAPAARGLLDAAMPLIQERGITLVGVRVTNLDAAEGAQLALEVG